jgi:hypothetical protein
LDAVNRGEILEANFTQLNGFVDGSRGADDEMVVFFAGLQFFGQVNVFLGVEGVFVSEKFLDKEQILSLVSHEGCARAGIGHAQAAAARI